MHALFAALGKCYAKYILLNGDKRILAANVVQQPKWVQSKMSQFVFNLGLVFLSNEDSSSGLEAANGEKATIAENLSRGGISW